MPGLVLPASAVPVGAVAGMKRAFADGMAPSQRGPHSKKRKVERKLQYTQPVEQIKEPLNGELDFTGHSRGFFDQQLKRAIAVELRAVGFDAATPDAMEDMRGLVDEYMRKFLSNVRTSMSSGRRTTTVPHDWVYALASAGITGSSMLEQHLDTGEIPPSFLQPQLAPPDPPEEPPLDVESLLGPALSGREDKESRKYIPSHLPAFPPRHTWKATPVFTEREKDPRRIREKATAEGIVAEQSLRRLMKAQKDGMQGDRARKQRRSKAARHSDELWQAAMDELAETEERENLERSQADEGLYEDVQPKNEPLKKVTGNVNYDKQFWRQSARGF